MEEFITYLFVYVISFILSAYALSSVNFNGLIKKGYIYQAQVLFLLITIALSYLLSNAVLSLMYFVVE